MRLFVEVQRRGNPKGSDWLSGRKLVGARDRPHAVQCVRAAPRRPSVRLRTPRTRLSDRLAGAWQGWSGTSLERDPHAATGWDQSDHSHGWVLGPSPTTVLRCRRTPSIRAQRCAPRILFGEGGRSGLRRWLGCSALHRRQRLWCRRTPVCRSLGAGSPRVNPERVCDSLDGPMGDVIREAERAEWQSNPAVGKEPSFTLPNGLLVFRHSRAV
jgi:hypothetical protein